MPLSRGPHERDATRGHGLGLVPRPVIRQGQAQRVEDVPGHAPVLVRLDELGSPAQMIDGLAEPPESARGRPQHPQVGGQPDAEGPGEVDTPARVVVGELELA